METVTDFIFLGSKITADGDRTHPPPAPLPSPCTHLSLLELVGGRSGLGFRPRGLGGGFSAAEEKRGKLARIWGRRVSSLGGPPPAPPSPTRPGPGPGPAQHPQPTYLASGPAEAS